MIRFVLIMFVLGFQGSVAKADDAEVKSKRAAVQELMKTTRVEVEAKKMFMDGAKASVATESPEEQKAFLAMVEKEADFSKLFEEISEVYVKTFSLEEIQQFNSFYQSKAGKKWVENQASLAQTTSVIIKSWMDKLEEKMEALAEKEEASSPKPKKAKAKSKSK
jgi:hypothetical protein